MYLTQTKYVMDLLHRTTVHEAKPLKSPMQAGLKLSRYDGNPVPNAQEYRAVMGALQYVNLTRPDIVLQVNQVIHDPRSTH